MVKHKSCWWVLVLSGSQLKKIFNFQVLNYFGESFSLPYLIFLLVLFSHKCIRIKLIRIMSKLYILLMLRMCNEKQYGFVFLYERRWLVSHCEDSVQCLCLCGVKFHLIYFFGKKISVFSLVFFSSSCLLA